MQTQCSGTCVRTSAGRGRGCGSGGGGGGRRGSRYTLQPGDQLRRCSTTSRGTVHTTNLAQE